MCYYISMKKFISYLQFILLFLRIKWIGITSRFPPLHGDALDEQTALMRRAQVILGEVLLEHLSIAQARSAFSNNFPLLKMIGGLFEKVHSTRNLSIPSPNGDIPARLYLPGAGKEYPLLVYFHGGGWVIGGLDTADNVSRFFCRHIPCAVLSVDYRLAPEHPFPAAVEDAVSAVAWAAVHARELNGDPARLLVSGDSAGGTLTAVVAQQALQKGTPRLAAQVLLYASTDSSSFDTPSYRLFGDKTLGLPRKDVEWFLEQYVPDSSKRLDPRVSPLLSKNMQNLPPSIVVTAEFDVLRDEGETYARRLQEAGVPVQLIRCNGMTHGFLSTLGLIHRSAQYFHQVIAAIQKMIAV
jgi:acetyl esterase